MTHITLIDGAIKSVVDSQNRKCNRIIYTRVELLSYRHCRSAQGWPPFFDKRFARSRLVRNPYGYVSFNRICESRDNNLESNRYNPPNYTEKYLEPLPNPKSSSEYRRYYDDAIAFAGDLKPLSSDGASDNRRGFYDHPDLSLRPRKYYPRFQKYTPHEPEWYVYGPQAIDEEMELAEYDMAAGDEEKENNTLSGLETQSKITKSIPEDAGIVEEYTSKGTKTTKGLESYLRSFLKQKSGETNQKGDRPPNIKTLREIESKLKVQRSETKSSGDMSAYYKLLGLVGNSVNSSKGDYHESSPRNREVDNNQPQTLIEETCPSALSNSKSLASEVYTDPAVSEVVESNGCSFGNVAASSNRSNKQKIIPTQSKYVKQEQINVATRVACNPLAASYQRQVMATGPLGQNALRWFKAMTNAASASACISQHLEGSNGGSSDGIVTKSGSLDLDQKHDHASCKEDGFAETLTDQGLSAERYNHLNDISTENVLESKMNDPTFNSPFGLGMGINMPARPIKPLMFYYHPQAAQLLGRPMLHPFLLQQLIQRQLDIRNAALNLPLNYLRTQTMIPMLSENSLYSQGLVSKISDPRTASYCSDVPCSYTQPTSGLLQEVNSDE
ncbi:unnamed protein product [Calicophoron daubneyi]|uniref:Uncharacterized protein n=1 Tax=Calicophoron daubneyi TaxID=300641 RepID=A0AAV2T2U5_CALDB